ncbi:MAG: cell division protein FtsQ/DivIB [Acidimicrobiia bacterium]
MTLTVSPGRSPGRVVIDPRLRARRIAVRRDEGRRRLRRLAVLGGVLGLLSGSFGAVRSPLFDVDRIAVEGSERTPVEAVEAAAGIHRGDAMVDVDLAQARAAVAALPWVRTVAVSRRWPGSVSIAVTERVPRAAVAVDGGGFALVDDEARLLATSSTAPDDIVVIDGASAGGPPGSTIEGIGAGLDVARALTPALAGRTGSVSVSEGLARLVLSDGGEVRMGTVDDLDAKVLAAETMLAKADLSELCAVDVRVPSAPTLTRGRTCA